MTTVIDSATTKAPVGGVQEQRILLEGISREHFEQLSACFQSRATR